MEGQTTSQPPPESNQDDEDPPKVDLPEQLQKIVPATELPSSLNRWNTNEVSTWVEPPHRRYNFHTCLVVHACVQARAHTHTHMQSVPRHVHTCTQTRDTHTHTHTHTHTVTHYTYMCMHSMHILYFKCVSTS